MTERILRETDLYYTKLENFENENKYIIRTGQFKYFESSKFVIQISETFQNDEDLMEMGLRLCVE